jgi:hypothetical protein
MFPSNLFPMSYGHHVKIYTKSAVILSTLFFFMTIWQSESAAQIDFHIDRVPATCAIFAEGTIGQAACLMAQIYNISFLKAIEVISIASAETASSFCGYDLVDDFEDLKAAALDTGDSKELYQFLRDIDDTSMIDDKTSWCKMPYRAFGPNAENGPDGEDYQLLK